MSIKCLMNGLEANYPCSPVCALFGDCVIAFEAQKKENARTNADRIRVMSDEELAELLCCTGWRLSEQKECLEWLQQEADEINI